MVGIESSWILIEDKFHMTKASTRTIFFLAWRGTKHYAFSSLVASAAIALAGGLFLSTWKLKNEANKSFSNATGGFDAVLGARGSKLQLILNSLFHLEDSPGNLSWEQYELIKSNRGTRAAYPIAVGDNYMGYRLVGTLPDLFLKHEWKAGKKYGIEPGGRVFSEMAKEALVGSFVAQKLGLKVGDQFHPYHGLTFREDSKHKDLYLVVGILKPTGTPVDRVIWIPIKGIQMMDGHDQAMAQSVSAVLLSLKGSAGFQLDLKYNKQGNQATLAWPVASTLSRFFEKLNWFEEILSMISYLVAIIGALIITATLRIAMNERTREFAILRCMGATRMQVTSVVLAQSILISIFGIIGACITFLVIHSIAAHAIREQTGVLMESTSFDLVSIFVFLTILLLGLASGLIPAFQAYRISLSENLKPRS